MIKVNARKILLFLFTLSIFCNGYLMFIWDTYIGVLGIIAKSLRIFSFAFLPSIILLYQKKIVIKKWFVVYIIAIILQFHMCFMGGIYKGRINLTIINLFINLFCFFILDKEDRVQIQKYAIYIFVISCLPSLIYFIFYNIGIQIPAEILFSDQPAKIRNEVYYLHYPLGLLIHQRGVFFYRISGIFDEAGFVGTMAALFIASGYKRVNKRWLILLIIEGIFSLSMAFYLLIIIFVIAESLRRGAFKFGITLLLIVGMVNIFSNVKFENPTLAAIQSRIDTSSFYGVKDNRTSKIFDDMFDDFLEDKNYEYYFGNGMNAVAKDNRINASYSYKCLIYDYGIIGLSILIIYLVVSARIIGTNTNILPYFIVFVASIYQRPYVFTTMYIFIYLSALELINSEMKISENKKWRMYKC